MAMCTLQLAQDLMQTYDKEALMKSTTRITYLLTAIYAAVVAAYIFAYFTQGQGPDMLLARVTTLYTAIVACNCVCSAYAYKCTLDHETHMLSHHKKGDKTP